MLLNRKLMVGLAGCLALVLFTLGPARSVQAQIHGAFAPPAEGHGVRDLTVLPLVAQNIDAAMSADLSAMIFTDLKEYEGIDVRIRAPASPPTPQCLASAPCIKKLGKSLAAKQLLVGVAQGMSSHISITLELFEVSGGRSMQRISIDLVGDEKRFGRMLRPIVHEIAIAAGGRKKEPTVESGQANGDSGQENDPDKSAPTPEPTHSLDSLLDLPATTNTAPAPLEASIPATQTNTSPAGTYSEEKPLTTKEQLKAEKKRQKERKKQERLEAVQREKDRKAAEAERAQQYQTAQKEAEETRKRELLEARAREEETARRRKEAEARRKENMKRAAKGLPPLPEPEPTPKQEPPPSVKMEGPAAPTPARVRRMETKRKRTTVVQKTQPTTPDHSDVAGMDKENEPETRFVLENDGLWQVGTFGGLTYFVGFGLFGTGLEGAYMVQPWLWVEGALESLHSKDSTTGEWFYLLNTRVGAVVRREIGPTHPFAGIDIAALTFGRSANAWGAMARGGLDIMISPGIGIRLEVAGGAVHSTDLSNDIYQYPESTQMLLRLGAGLRYHF